MDALPPDTVAANDIVAYVANVLPPEARFMMLVAIPDGTPEGIAIVSLGNAPPQMLARRWLDCIESESRAGGQGAAAATPSAPERGPVPGAG